MVRPLMIAKLLAYLTKSFLIKASILCIQAVVMKYGWDTNYFQELLNLYGLKVFVSTYLESTGLGIAPKGYTLEQLNHRLYKDIVKNNLGRPRIEVFQHIREIIGEVIPSHMEPIGRIKYEPYQLFCFNFPRILMGITCGLVLGASAAILRTIIIPA